MKRLKHARSMISLICILSMIFCQTVYADTSVIGTEDGGQFATDLDFESEGANASGTQIDTKSTKYTGIATYDVEFLLSHPIKTGYSFQYWMVSKLGPQGQEQFLVDAEFIDDTSISEASKKQVIMDKFKNLSNIHNDEITFRAFWKARHYTVYLDLSNGSYAGDDHAHSIDYTIESDPVAIGKPARHGYDFTGWSSVSGDMALSDGFISSDHLSVTVPTGTHADLYYKASWDTTKYSISYNLAGGVMEEGKSNVGIYDIETGNISLVAPVRTGYDFKGWTGSNGTTPQVDVEIPLGSTGNKEYTANWEPIVYSISYNLAGGNVTGNPLTYTIETNNIVLRPPSKTGYNFTGWIGTDVDTKSISVTIPKGSIGDREFVATWDPIGYTINIDLK